MNYEHEIVQFDEKLQIHYFYSNNGKPNYVLPHYHSAIEIIYILEGHVNITTGTHSYTLYPGDIKIFNSNEIHSTYTDVDYTTAYIMQISTEYISSICRAPIHRSFFIPLYSDVTISPENKKNVILFQNEITKFFDRSKSTEVYAYIELQSILHKMIYYMYSHFLQKEHSTTLNKHKTFDSVIKIEKYIKAHYTENLSLADIASYMGFTTTYFSKFFKNTFGITFSNYLCSLRLEKASIDLATTDYPILDISERNGFANYQLFTIKFKKHYHCTPSQYRKNILN